jgi:hypothetical protein
MRKDQALRKVMMIRDYLKGGKDYFLKTRTRIKG